MYDQALLSYFLHVVHTGRTMVSLYLPLNEHSKIPKLYSNIPEYIGIFAEQSYQVVSHLSLTGAKEPNLFFSIHTLPGPPIAFRIATFHSLP